MGSGCSTSSSTKHGKTEVITVKAAPNEPPPSQEPVETATAPPVAEIDPSKAAKLGALGNQPTPYGSDSGKERRTQVQRPSMHGGGLQLEAVGGRSKSSVPSSKVVETQGKQILFCLATLRIVPGCPDQGALKGTNLRGQTEPKCRFSQIFADFCRFSPFPRKQSVWETQILAENC